jgi:BirA family transcriptional regulator, biotin operon repressor / biotin---[acetyl-CoA-carboxylase] ligase
MISEDFTPKVLRFGAVDSTNQTAKELAEKGAAEGTIIVADSQLHGKGRGEHTWHSPQGGLYLSALLYPDDAKHATDLSILAGIAVAQAVTELLPKSSDVTLKWPNDCLLNWKKVSGILCEALGEKVFGLCVVGIGLNVNVKPQELLPFQQNPFSATSFLSEFNGEAFDLAQVESMLVSKLFTLYRTYHAKGGREAIRYLWEKNCRFIGKRVELSDTGWHHGDSRKRASEAGVALGTVLGLDENGAIVLANAKGERHSYASGEITCYWP